MDSINLYEILVPTIKDGKPIRTRYHKIWDEKVRKISGGLTIFNPAKGNWIGPDGQLVIERMIPVRVACTEAQIKEIGKMTAEYYNQLEVMVYLVSEKVFFIKK